MTARWGFDLDMSAVRLMRREGNHWQEVARENIDGPDIEDRLLALVGKVDSGSPVELFLPRDQILYTDVKISSESAAPGEIRTAMDGRTPYALDELSFDWARSAPDTARVAAIAEETLDEAAAFAEARGLSVAGFSSLADADDFPRLPVFRGKVPREPKADTSDSQPAVQDVPAETGATFATTRSSASSRPSPMLADEDGPVLKIDDANPVLRVRSDTLPPLNPGAPIDRAPSAPRVRTDIAAGTLSGVAASLTPGRPSIRVHSRGAGPWRTLAVFAAAAILTIGIAVIVWSILPLSPDRPAAPLPAQTEPAPAVEPVPRDEAAAAPVEAPELSQPDVFAEIGDPLPEIAGDSSLGYDFTPDTAAARARDMAPLAAVDPEATLPTLVEPLERRTDALAAALTEDPVQSLDGSEDMSETTLDIYFASIEPQELAFDAIALPAQGSISPDALPLAGQPPAPLPEEPEAAPEVASVSPTLPSVAPFAPANRLEPTRPLTELADDTPSAETPAEPQAIVADAPVEELPLQTAEEPQAETETAPAGLRPTALAAALPDRSPRARPGTFTQDLERQKFGGRTRTELARIKPKARPDSAQIVALAARPAETTASELAVESSIKPRSRPRGFDAVVAAALAQAKAREITASLSYQTPDTSSAIEAALSEDEEPEPRPQDSPRLAIPTGASVARQATVEDAIPLNKINLVGVYGLLSDRRALIRLASGRYVKVKVGDKVDGGVVARIDDTELLYTKGSRTYSLSLPKG